jgi:hypothetical protein
MASCFECTIGVAHNAEAIGVCKRCNSLGCANHGGKPRGQPRFICSGCIAGILTTSSGGGPTGGPPGSGGGGGPTGGPPGSGGGGPTGAPQAQPTAGGQETTGFSSTFDFEIQLPAVALASEPWRRSIDADSLRRSVRRLFRLLRDEESARAEFLDRAGDEVRVPVRDQVARQLRESAELRQVFEEERGGLGPLTDAGVAEILNRIRFWFENELEPWMGSIYPTLDETVWLGERYSTGAIDILLLADALGLNAYEWNLEIGASPFRRLDVVGRCDTGMLVLSELYAQSVGAIA